MKKLLALVLTFALSFSSALMAQTVDESNPYLLIKEVSQNTFDLLKKNPKPYQDNPELLRAVVEKQLIPYINVRYAALKLLGPLAKKATRTERDEFTEAFHQYLVASYAQILTQYTDQKVTVEAPKPISEKRKVVSVRVDIVDASRPPIRLDFKLRQNNKTKDWQGFDVQVEGVSMLDTKTSEWSSTLRKDGIAKVAQMLEKLAKMPIKKKES